jgi:topoisomerase-4 subunit A
VVHQIDAAHDYVIALGENRKMVVFPLTELPEMGRGAGVQLQRYRDGGLAVAATFRIGAGIAWSMGGDSGRIRTEPDLTPWRTARGAAGRMPPNGFPRDNTFTAA